MKIAIVGYGKMGHEIEKHCRRLNYDIVAVIDNEDDWKTKSDTLMQAKVAIEFTAPHIVVSNLKRLLDLKIPVVTGTTGWKEKLDEIRNYCQKSNGTLFYASNFSIGVNLFFAMNRYLAKLMAGYPDYKIDVEEIHHTQKLDTPSGTAISMVDDIISENKNYKGWKLVADKPGEDEIPVEARRIEGVTGTHSLSYTSGIDTISLRHEAFNRDGFAMGALMAAEWVRDKKGVFTMNDLLNI
ncbi:MAG: 4-hydroxy-tetrahydrodipicolinate reductase [Bacteroidetes bacterium]|nr:MAG: 4-hydroxy-tetrahydrodipicolinate reductase [Bacteroidota bacterium]